MNYRIDQRLAANWRHDLDMAARKHRQPVCPDCLKPPKECLHREAWEFLCPPVRR
jgi:hypothetical protein